MSFTLPDTANGSPIAGAPADILALTQRRLDELDRLRAIGMQQAEKLAEKTQNLAGSPVEQYRAMVGGNGTIREFDRLNRAIRQIVVLEYELRGLFKAPDREGIKKPKLGTFRFDGLADLDDLFDFDRERSDLNDINDLNDLRVRLDYRKDPIDRLVADIRSMLGVMAPKDDPFAERPSCPATPAAMSREAAVLERAQETLHRVAVAKTRATMPARPVEAASPARALAPVKAPAAKAAVAKPTNFTRKGFRIPPTSPHNPNTPPGAKKRRRNRGPPR